MNSSAKGSRFEREVCRALSLWLTNGKNPNVFWRTAASGARATAHAKKGVRIKAHEGDIMAIEKVGEDLTRIFLLECKHRRDLDIGSFLCGQGGHIQKVWRRLKRDSKKGQKRPMLIFKNNRCDTMLMLDRKGFYMFFGVEIKLDREFSDGMPDLHIVHDKYNAYIIRLKDFCELAVLGKPVR